MSKTTTPLAQAYQELLAHGLIVVAPIEPTEDFRYPSVLTPIASITTSDLRGSWTAKEDDDAKLEGRSNRNP